MDGYYSIQDQNPVLPACGFLRRKRVKYCAYGNNRPAIATHRLVIRLLAWNEWQPVFLKLAARLSQPLRC